MLKYLALAIIIMSLLLTGVQADYSKTILVVTESWQNGTNVDGTGLYFDIIRAIYEPKGYTVKYKIMPYNRSTNLVKKGDADIVIGVYAGELDGVLFPKWHFSSDLISAFFLKGSSWEGEKSLNNKKVVWMRGYSYDSYISTPMKFSEVDDRAIALQLLKSKRIDYFLDSPDDTLDFIKSSSSSKSPKLVFTPSDFEVKKVKALNMYTCFVKSEKGAHLVKLWDKEIQKLISSGKIKELFKKWDQIDYYNF